MDFLNRLNGPDLSLLLLLIGGMLITGLLALPALLLYARHQARSAEHEHELKLQENALKGEMLAKGLPAEEIARVVQATATPTLPPLRTATAALQAMATPALAMGGTANGPGFHKTRLVQVLLAREFEAADIERLLRLLDDCLDEEQPAKVAAIENMLNFEMEAADIERVIRAFHRETKLSVPAARPTAFRE